MEKHANKNRMEIELWQQLTEFGLNPQEWVLTRGRDSSFFICEAETYEIFFKGAFQIKADAVRWQELQLVTT